MYPSVRDSLLCESIGGIIHSLPLAYAKIMFLDYIPLTTSHQGETTQLDGCTSACPQHRVGKIVELSASALEFYLLSPPLLLLLLPNIQFDPLVY